MKRKWSVTATAVIASAVLALSACGGNSASSASTADAGTAPFTVGGLFPLTGSFAFVGPANIAALKLAQQDINAAGGVLGESLEVVTADTSDADHADQNTSSAQSVLAKEPSVVVGPPSSSVVKNTYKQVTAAQVPMISPGATSPAFSGINDYFFRTIPPDTVQGVVLGQLIAQDGVKNLAIAVGNEEYGTSLRKVVVDTVKEAGVNVVYGETEAFDPTETNFSSMVTAIKAANPDATLVITFDQTVPLVKELATQGIDTHKIYMSDSNTADHSEDFESGLLQGSKGTIPGAHPTQELEEQLLKIDPKLTDFTYTGETYDAAVLAALAAEKGGSRDGDVVQKNLAAVSGATDGEECTSYKDCLALVKDGKEIQYKGYTAIGAFNDAHDPSTASIGIYKYDADNKPVFDSSQEGAVPTA